MMSLKIRKKVPGVIGRRIRANYSDAEPMITIKNNVYDYVKMLPRWIQSRGNHKYIVNAVVIVNLVYYCIYRKCIVLVVV